MLISFAIRCTTAEQTKAAGLLIASKMKVTFALLCAQTPGINIHPSSLEKARHSSNIKYNNEEDEHTSTALVRVVDPAILDLEENVLNEAD